MKYLRYLVPSGITAVALACGVLAIIHGANGNPIEGSWWVLYATILDRMDGLAARTLNASSTFGMWLDSTSDFVAFGIAPAFLFMGANPQGFELILLPAMLFYILGAGTRLVRFSLHEAQKEFEGVPSTLAGGLFAVGISVGLSYGLTDLWFYGAVLVLFGIAMNTPSLRYAKVGGLSSPWLNYLGIAMVTVCAILIVARQLPEFILFSAALIFLTAPLISRSERHATS